jgi:hypothetical protein
MFELVIAGKKRLPVGKADKGIYQLFLFVKS